MYSWSFENKVTPCTNLFSEKKFGINGTWINAITTSLALITKLHIYHKKPNKLSI